MSNLYIYYPKYRNFQLALIKIEISKADYQFIYFCVQVCEFSRKIR